MRPLIINKYFFFGFLGNIVGFRRPIAVQVNDAIIYQYSITRLSAIQSIVPFTGYRFIIN